MSRKPSSSSTSKITGLDVIGFRSLRIFHRLSMLSREMEDDGSISIAAGESPVSTLRAGNVPVRRRTAARRCGSREEPVTVFFSLTKKKRIHRHDESPSDAPNRHRFPREVRRKVTVIPPNIKQSVTFGYSEGYPAKNQNKIIRYFNRFPRDIYWGAVASKLPDNSCATHSR